MKQKIKNTEIDNGITIYRYKVDDLEKKLLQQHEVIKTDIAIALGKDLGAMQPSKPEPNCEKDVYSGIISGAYSKMMMTAEKELQSEIESHHIVSDKAESEIKLKELSTTLEKKETDLRLKNRELEKCDDSLIKKDKRYRFPVRPGLLFLILVDTLISGSALQAMGYSLITSYVLGFAIGLGIFYVAENLPEYIQKGRTPMEKKIIAVGAFVFLFCLFYVLGLFRSTSFTNSTQFGTGIKPIYFVCINMFFTIIATLLVHSKGLSKTEKKTLDKYYLAKEAVDKLDAEIKELKKAILKIRSEQSNSELARKQILIYARSIQELIQRLYEESQKTFYSTNCIHRSDGKIPKFFEQPIPKLPTFNNTLN